MLGLQPDEDALVAAVRSFDVRRLRRARALRRTFFVALAIFVLAGAANLLGGRTATATATSGGYELRVTYATVARPGQNGDWEVEVQHPGGFQDPVRIAADSSYLDMFDQSQVRPEPESTSTGGGRTIWEFAAPAGDTLEITIEAQFDQRSMGVHHGATTLLASGGSQGEPDAGTRGGIVGVAYRTVVLP